MSDVLILMLGQSPEDPVRWAFVDEDGVVSADIAPDAHALLSLARKSVTAKTVAAVLPGEQAAMRILPAPPGAASKFRAAAGYLLEDELAEPLEALHVATSRRVEGAGAAFAVKKSVMEAWKSVFEDLELHADILTVDFDLLSYDKSGGVLVFEDERLFCTIGERGFAGERPVSDVIAEKLISVEAIGSLIAYGDPDAEKFDAGAKSIMWRGLADDATIFELMAHGVRRGGGVNFLQGAYRKRTDWRAALGPWRRAGMLAAACLAGAIFWTAADAIRSERLTSALKSEMRAIHQNAFPESANADPVRHAKSVLASSGHGAGFLRLTAHLAEGLGDEGRIQVDRIRYNNTRNEFSVSLSFADINDLEALKRRLSGRGLRVSEVGGVRLSQGRYVGDLEVSTP